jgi:hypothetical protein
MSPELLQGLSEGITHLTHVDSPLVNVGMAADIYAFGLTLYWLFTGQRLPKHPGPGLRHDLPADLPPELARLIHGCTEYDPHLRPTAMEIAITPVISHAMCFSMIEKVNSAHSGTKSGDLTRVARSFFKLNANSAACLHGSSPRFAYIRELALAYDAQLQRMLVGLHMLEPGAAEHRAFLCRVERCANSASTASRDGAAKAHLQLVKERRLADEAARAELKAATDRRAGILSQGGLSLASAGRPFTRRQAAGTRQAADEAAAVHAQLALEAVAQHEAARDVAAASTRAAAAVAAAVVATPAAAALAGPDATPAHVSAGEASAATAVPAAMQHPNSRRIGRARTGAAGGFATASVVAAPAAFDASGRIGGSAAAGHLDRGVYGTETGSSSSSGGALGGSGWFMQVMFPDDVISVAATRASPLEIAFKGLVLALWPPGSPESVARLAWFRRTAAARVLPMWTLDRAGRLGETPGDGIPPEDMNAACVSRVAANYAAITTALGLPDRRMYPDAMAPGRVTDFLALAFAAWNGTRVTPGQKIAHTRGGPAKFGVKFERGDNIAPISAVSATAAVPAGVSAASELQLPGLVASSQFAVEYPTSGGNRVAFGNSSSTRLGALSSSLHHDGDAPLLPNAVLESNSRDPVSVSRGSDRAALPRTLKRELGSHAETALSSLLLEQLQPEEPETHDAENVVFIEHNPGPFDLIVTTETVAAAAAQPLELRQHAQASPQLLMDVSPGLSRADCPQTPASGHLHQRSLSLPRYSLRGPRAARATT